MEELNGMCIRIFISRDKLPQLILILDGAWKWNEERSFYIVVKGVLRYEWNPCPQSQKTVWVGMLEKKSK